MMISYNFEEGQRVADHLSALGNRMLQNPGHSGEWEVLARRIAEFGDAIAKAVTSMRATVEPTQAPTHGPTDRPEAVSTPIPVKTPAASPTGFPEPDTAEQIATLLGELRTHSEAAIIGPAGDAIRTRFNDLEAAARSLR